jgi:truncated hemoglobin YjbI
METPDSGKIINLVTLIGLLVFLFVIYKILDAAGLIKTHADKVADAKRAAAVTDLRISDYFSPEYYKTFQTQPLSDNQASQYAKQLRGAMAGIGTDEETIYTIFGALPNHVAISQVANEYKKQYGFPFYILSNSLQDDLLNELSPKEVEVLMSIINKIS